MSKVDDALNAGRKAVVQRSANLGVLGDPAGREHERGRLREMGKWRFILLRGIIGFSGPMFFWLVLTRLSEDIHAAREFHRNTLSYLLHSWVVALFLSAFMGSVVGLLAWRRLVSEVWPGAKLDPESPITTLGPLRGQR
jgi:hypothetical protein